MNCDSDMLCPVIRPEYIIVYDIGDLSKGLYYYVITAIKDSMESLPSHIIQVYAKNKNNSIALSWSIIPGIEEYRIYRGITLGTFDGYFTVGPTGYFCDAGFGILNEEQLNPSNI